MESVWTIYNYNPAGWDAALGAAVLIAGFTYFQRRLDGMRNAWGVFDYAPRRRGRAMRRARRDFIRSDTIDALVDHIEKRVAQGDYTRKEAKELYREARKAWQVKDLFPNPELLKENIQKRLVKHVNDPVPLPDRVKKPIFTGKRPVKA